MLIVIWCVRVGDTVIDLPRTLLLDVYVIMIFAEVTCLVSRRIFQVGRNAPFKLHIKNKELCSRWGSCDLVFCGAGDGHTRLVRRHRGLSEVGDYKPYSSFRSSSSVFPSQDSSFLKGVTKGTKAPRALIAGLRGSSSLKCLLCLQVFLSALMTHGRLFILLTHLPLHNVFLSSWVQRNSLTLSNRHLQQNLPQWHAVGYISPLQLSPLPHLPCKRVPVWCGTSLLYQKVHGVTSGPCLDVWFVFITPLPAQGALHTVSD